MPGSSERGPSEMDKVIEKPLREYATDRFTDELGAGLGLDLLLPCVEDGCSVEDLNKLLASLPGFGAEREREDVYTRGELVMHTLARFAAYYAKTDTRFEPLAPIPLEEEELERQADLRRAFINNQNARLGLHRALAYYLAQHLETEEDIELCINLLGDQSFQYHFARYLTALTRPDLLQRDRPGERLLEKSEDLKEYRIYRSGVLLPSLGELEKAFSGAQSVSSVFDGLPFDRDPAYKGAFSGPGESILAVRASDRGILVKTAINRMKDTHYPAAETDLYDFSLIYPGLRDPNWLLACGSFTVRDGDQCVAVLGSGSNWRYLGGGLFDRRWLRGRRFLFVRK